MGLGSTIRGLRVQPPAAITRSKPGVRPAPSVSSTAKVTAGSILLPKMMAALKRSDPVQSSALIRASGAHQYCSRAEALERAYGEDEKALSVATGHAYDLDGEPVEDNGGIELVATMAMGKAAHHYYQNTVLGPAGLLIGHWECLRCGAHWGGPKKEQWRPHPDYWQRALKGKEPPMTRLPGVPACLHTRVELIEAHATDLVLGASGHMDGGFRHVRKLLGFELKTISQRGFDRLKRPPMEHVVQATIYCKLWDLEGVLFLYLSKGWHPSTSVTNPKPVSQGFELGPYKEFLIEPDWSVISNIQLGRARAVDSVALYRDTSIPSFPTRLPACKGPQSSRCKDCAVSDICWSLK